MRLMFALVSATLFFSLSLHSEVLSSESHFTSSMENNGEMVCKDDAVNLDQLSDLANATQDKVALPDCTDSEMKVFDKFLKNKQQTIMDKWGDHGINGWQEYLDKIVVDRIEYYYTDKPENDAHRQKGCRRFANYCKGTLTDLSDINRVTVEGPDDIKINKYVDESCTPKGLLVLFCASGLEAGLIACLVIDKNVDCDRTFFARVDDIGQK